MQSYIGHLDADCFYVSAERIRDPFLIGKPVGVLGNQGACVIAKSYEMKARGVKTGDPIWEALKLCPEGVYVKRDFRWYEVLSRQMLAVVRELSPCVEYYSIDEFFFSVPRSPSVDPHAIACHIRDHVKARTGLPVTVAVARTRTLAKLFADTAKPFGAVGIVDTTTEQKLLASLSVDEISGIGRRRAARLQTYGIKTCLDFARMNRSHVRALLTIVGDQLWREVNGECVHHLQPERPPHQTISRGGSIGKATDDPIRVQAWLVRNLERLVEELDYHRVRIGKLTVLIGHRDAPTGICTISLDAVTDRFDLLLDAAREGLQAAWRRSELVDRIDLVASGLRGERYVQRSLFEPPGEQSAAIAQLKREVNAIVGRFALRSGATLPLTEIYRDDSHDYDICDVRGKVCF